MSKFYSKDDRVRIERLNQVLGMKHRSKPYDFKNIDDVKEAFMLTVAEFIDYQKYYLQVAQVYDDFDESLEYYDPVSWMSLDDENIKGDSLSLKADSALRRVESALVKVIERSQKRCKDLLVTILNENVDFQTAVLGKGYSFDDRLLDQIFEDSMETNDTYSMQESRDAFLELIDKSLPHMKE